MPPSHIPGSMRTPSSIAVLDEGIGQLRSELGKVEEGDRAVISLIHLEGCSVEEEAQREWATETAARRLGRALGRLEPKLRRHRREDFR